MRLIRFFTQDFERPTSFAIFWRLHSGLFHPHFPQFAATDYPFFFHRDLPCCLLSAYIPTGGLGHDVRKQYRLFNGLA